MHARPRLPCLTDAVELEQQRERAVALGATILDDRSTDPEEALDVLADPSGRPFCLTSRADPPRSSPAPRPVRVRAAGSAGRTRPCRRARRASA
ncbi:VOC family protein [Rathayibacter sp. VKM Ac-2760]|uniref:VOC family protein n=1 Tax=Rathayibacter sp. VKM Ac-2760 TaxID=2609253 RepID=UPI00329831F2